VLLPFFQPETVEAGIDEAGRGCYAGPVFAAAVILPAGFCHPLLNDSKQLKETDRNLLRPIIEREAVGWHVQAVDEATIDRINILQATYQAMHGAVAGLQTKPQLLLVDGNRFRPYAGIAHQCVVKGDATYASIAAASVLAKTHRDEYMYRLHEQYPQYGWLQNKGYGTLQHRQAIARYGLCPHHRKSFRLLPVQGSLPL
jgi:ribonuclease HII